MEEAEFVSVPRALLAEVLDTAESNSFATENEYACSVAHSDECDADRLKIEELRRISGIDNRTATAGKAGTNSVNAQADALPVSR